MNTTTIKMETCTEGCGPVLSNPQIHRLLNCTETNMQIYYPNANINTLVS